MSSNNKMFKKYLNDRSSEMRRNDPKFSLHLNSEFITKCRNEWKHLSDDEKRLYVMTGRSTQTNGAVPPYRPAIDPSFEDNERAVFEEEVQRKLIDRLVKYKTTEDLMKTDFYLISTNILCVVQKREDREYLPIEFGLVEYSIKDGIKRTFHQFVNCGQIPFGYTFSALNHQKTHQIEVSTLNTFEEASNDFKTIGDQILEFLAESRAKTGRSGESDNSMIVFSMDDQTDQNAGALNWISVKHKQKAEISGNEWEAKVLPVSELLFGLYSSQGISRSLGSAKNDMTSSAFDYSYGTDCSFHASKQCIDCALGVAKRMTYILSDCMLKVFKFSPKASHFPASDSGQKVTTWPVAERFSTLEIISNCSEFTDSVVSETTEEVNDFFDWTDCSESNMSFADDCEEKKTKAPEGGIECTKAPEGGIECTQHSQQEVGNEEHLKRDIEIKTAPQVDIGNKTATEGGVEGQIDLSTRSVVPKRGIGRGIRRNIK